jgi:hypothetical protein
MAATAICAQYDAAQAQEKCMQRPSETLGLATQPTCYSAQFCITFSCIPLYLYCRRLAALLAYFFEWVLFLGLV